MTNELKCIDSFSGAGGLSLGLQKAGAEVILSFDNDPIAIETLKQNRKYFNHDVVLGKIQDFASGKHDKNIPVKKGDLFLLAGGPPCQGFSIQRMGEDSDFRNDLIFSYIKFVSRLEPKFFLMENVPGILGQRGDKHFKLLIKKAAMLGYKTHFSVLNAENFGVPQRRKRVFLVGIRNDMYYAPFTFPTPIPTGKQMSVRDAIAHFPAPPSDGSEHQDVPNHRCDRLSAINIKRIMALKPGQGREHLPANLLIACHRKLAADKIGHRNVYGRMSWDDVAPTITARFDSFTRGKFGHPTQHRSITLREGAALQTFPDDFRFAGTKVEVARQIGNAVPVLLAEHVGRQIIVYYKSRTSRQHVLH